jgi:hypothetical protein
MGRKIYTPEQIFGKLLSPVRRCRAVKHMCEFLRVSERRACQVLGQARSTQRQITQGPPDEERWVGRITALATQYGRYGCRRITALLHQEGWKVNHKRFERIWCREGLKVPAKQPKRRRLWLNDGSCVRLRPIRNIMSGATISFSREHGKHRGEDPVH